MMELEEIVVTLDHEEKKDNKDQVDSEVILVY